jgi:hypothetical protein
MIMKSSAVAPIPATFKGPGAAGGKRRFSSR